MFKPLKTPLTPSILKFFINASYEYCLSRPLYTDTAVSAILLTPVKERPCLKQAQNYESLFQISDQLLEMAHSTDGPPVMIEMGSDCLAHFISYLFNGRSKNRIL